MNEQQLRQLLQRVSQGDVLPEMALEKLRTLAYEDLGFANVDHHRAIRTGFPEVVWGPGKTPEQIAEILQRLRDRNAVAMATRISPDTFEQIQTQSGLELEYFPTARICAAYSPTIPLEKCPGTVGIISAGTSDIPVAEEAAVTVQLCGFEVVRLWDLGVAGIHRLLDKAPILNQADVLIVVAGMEGALASIVGGLVRCPVIAVPTSIGYGASFGGLAALLSMLNSCAAGVGVVNIDNGFGAAMLASRILVKRPPL
ncbi:MAG: nickel pincer cofactor biosynthesis protein LarB [Gloeobacterales cyanobacterium]